MKKTLYIVGCLLGIGLQICAQSVDSLYKEKYRPQYHFSPKKGWIGDPCGFIHYQNKYHMFWWGKVESKDLVHYEEVTPFAMTGENIAMNYFTGSMVVDKQNTAGFGKNACVAVYTIAEKVSKSSPKVCLSATMENLFSIIRVILCWILVVRSFVILLSFIMNLLRGG